MSRKNSKNDGTKKTRTRSKKTTEAPAMTTEREAEIKQTVSGVLDSTGAENSSQPADSALTSADSKVSSSTSSPSPANPSPKAETETHQQEKQHMDLTLVRGKLSKSGKKAQFTNPALRRAIVLSAAIFVGGAFPESLTLSGDGFQTLGADEQAKAEARNAKRAEKGLKPKATPAERKAILDARAAKLAAKLDRAQKAAEKLSAKLGTAAPVAPATSEAPATV